MGLCEGQNKQQQQAVLHTKCDTLPLSDALRLALVLPSPFWPLQVP